VLLVIADYPFFKDGDFEAIRFQAFEIWNTNPRHNNFKLIMSNYYYKIFLEHIKMNPKGTPAPKNFWPFSFQFYLCNPVKVFSCLVKNVNLKPELEVEIFVKPDFDRNLLCSEAMPTCLLKFEELETIIKDVSKSKMESQIIKGFTFDDLKSVIKNKKINKKHLLKILPFIDEKTRSHLDLRDTDKISKAKKTYIRGK
jgi:hypothetical protein